MSPTLRPLAASLLLAALPAEVLAQVQPASQGSPVLPGYWQSDETYSVLLAGSSHGKKCLTAEQVNAFIAAPQTSHYRCVYASREVGDGTARFRGGACYSHKGGRKVLSNVDVDGRYAPESFQLHFRFNLQVSAGVGLPGVAAIEAHRISAECPATPPT